MKPPLPPYLDSEEKSLWAGWNMIGDREVVREAAVKGNVALALKFLAKRKDLDHADVERWLKTEVLAWVYQLLLRKQVFKASHILNNVGYDAAEQFSITLSETTDKELRDYIAEHLLKINKLDDALLKSWKFIKLIEGSNSSLKSLFGDVSKLTILQFDQMCGEFKAEIATEIFFESYDFSLESFVTSEYSWRHLLKKEEFEILKLWMKIYFTQDLNNHTDFNIDRETLTRLSNLFLLWPITHLMINEIETITSSKFFKNLILNELSTFGIFTNYEKYNVKSIVARFAQTGNLLNIYKVLEETTSNIRMSDYFEKLALYCVENNMFEVLSVCTKGYQYPDSTIQKIDSREFRLFISVNDTLGNLNNEKVLRKNIYQVSTFFGEENLQEYFRKHPMVLLGLIFYNRDVNVADVFSGKCEVVVGNISFDLRKLFEYLRGLPILRNVVMNFSSSESFSVFSLEELIGKNERLSCISKYDTESTYVDSTSVDFTSNVDYVYYIKKNRPSQAVKVFMLDELKKHESVSDFSRVQKSKIVQQIAMDNWMKNDVVASCVMFLEMIGSESETIRVITSAYNFLNTVKQLKSKPEKEFNLHELLQAVENISLEKYRANVFEHLPEIFFSEKLPIKLARVSDLELPEKFLTHCASNNYWFLFLVFAQVNNYPLDQIIRLVTNFENENLSEHLYHAISKDIQNYDDSNDLISSFSSQHSVNSTFSEISFDSPKTNLLTILIKCHKSEDPPTSLLLACQHYKYPLLAVLATCYEPDSVITNWLTWLSVSCDITLETVESYTFSPKTVTKLLTEVVQKKYIRTALESFEIFLPHHPLHLLFQFINLSVNFDFDSSVESLTSFETVVQQLKYNPIIEENDFEYLFLNNGFWIVETALKLIFAVLGNCFESRNHQIIFLDNLCSSNLSKNIPTECPNFCRISALLKSLSYSDVVIDLSSFSNPSDRKSEIVRCIELLINTKAFNYALELAKFEKIFKEYVLNAEWSYKFKTRKEQFWKDCDAAFRAAEILPSSAAEFFVNCCKELTDCPEKYEALKFAYTWLKESDYTDPYVENIEQEIWSNYFALNDETLKCSHYDKNETIYLLSELQENSVTKTKSSHTLTPEQLRHFDETIGKILVSGDVIEALRLEKMFDYKNIETSILMTCYELAEGKISPYQLSTEQRLLYMNRDMNLKSLTHRRRAHKSTRISGRSTGSFSSMSTEVETCEQSDEDTLNLLETMTERLKYGSNIASRILMCYRISLNVGKPYKTIVKCTDSYTLLRQALDADCTNKLDVVSDVFTIYKWTKKEISGFVCDEIKNAIDKSIQQNLDTVTMWDLILDKNFHFILQLCPDFASKLGEKLLKCANTIHFTHSQALSDDSDKDVVVIIELLIRSHECFTAECNMEGISAILRKAQALTSTLLALKSWNLMVRLLTGIGRYTEMNYIFQILKENDQFEYFLKKGYRNDNSLKVALLKFLKIHCPKNQKLFQMVALRFTLYSEVAELFETEALDIIENLIEISRLEMQNNGLSRTEKFVLLTKNESTEVCLKKAMENYTLAADYHLHGEKLGKALLVASQAELVALQLSLLNTIPNYKTSKCILLLQKPEIQYLILNELTFSQTKIFIEAYSCQPDWGAALFHRCILSSDLNYLNEFLKAYPLTNTLIQEVTGRFVPKKITSTSSVQAMKEFISRIKNVQVKYRIASELGFTEVIETMLNDPAALAFLKDTVWKKGYKQM